MGGDSRKQRSSKDGVVQWLPQRFATGVAGSLSAAGASTSVGAGVESPGLGLAPCTTPGEFSITSSSAGVGPGRIHAGSFVHVVGSCVTGCTLPDREQRSAAGLPVLGPGLATRPREETLKSACRSSKASDWPTGSLQLRPRRRSGPSSRPPHDRASAEQLYSFM